MCCLVEVSREQHLLEKKNLLQYYKYIYWSMYLCPCRIKKINILTSNKKKVVYNNYARNFPVDSLHKHFAYLLERSKVTCCVLYAVLLCQRERFYRLFRVKRNWAFQQSSLECESSMRTVMQCSIQRTWLKSPIDHQFYIYILHVHGWIFYSINCYYLSMQLANKQLIYKNWFWQD